MTDKSPSGWGEDKYISHVNKSMDEFIAKYFPSEKKRTDLTRDQINELRYMLMQI